jgi:hypothetical protein
MSVWWMVDAPSNARGHVDEAHPECAGGALNLGTKTQLQIHVDDVVDDPRV